MREGSQQIKEKEQSGLNPLATSITRRVGARTSYLRSARKNVLSRVLRLLTLSRDRTFLRAESRWMGRSYAPSRDGMFLRDELR